MPDTTRYVRTVSGSVMEITETDPGSAGTPEGGQTLSEPEGQAAIADAEASVTAYADGLRQADAARHQDAYNALMQVGLPESVARDLSGYQRDPRTGDR
ncbi:hypothetical protein [Streptomyces europaeiscabiei]|uniref:hypothetical protein n=1 Tax=Streptomyces europaeiscabiei TaxID=146819 RepID=UPI002E11C25E|nr:hypothetical protein OHB30_33425 [Streptomyces europaeiscabiei]